MVGSTSSYMVRSIVRPAAEMRSSTAPIPASGSTSKERRPAAATVVETEAAGTGAGPATALDPAGPATALDPAAPAAPGAAEDGA